MQANSTQTPTNTVIAKRTPQATQAAGTKVQTSKAKAKVNKPVPSYDTPLHLAATACTDMQKAAAQFATTAAILRKDKVLIGNRQATKKTPACAIAIRFYDDCLAQFKVAFPERTNDQHEKNVLKYLAAFKRMVNDGDKFDLNPSVTAARAKAKAERAKAKPSAQTEADDDTDNDAPESIKTTPEKTTITKPVKFTYATAQHALAQLACQIQADLGNGKDWNNLVTLWPSLAKIVNAKA